jgi:hypothetical protein
MAESGKEFQTLVPYLQLCGPTCKLNVYIAADFHRYLSTVECTAKLLNSIEFIVIASLFANYAMIQYVTWA